MSELKSVEQTQLDRVNQLKGILERRREYCQSKGEGRYSGTEGEANFQSDLLDLNTLDLTTDLKYFDWVCFRQLVWKSQGKGLVDNTFGSVQKKLDEAADRISLNRVRYEDCLEHLKRVGLVRGDKLVFRWL